MNIRRKNLEKLISENKTLLKKIQELESEVEIFHRISDLSIDSHDTVEVLLVKIARLLPSGLFDPINSTVRISYEGKNYLSCKTRFGKAGYRFQQQISEGKELIIEVSLKHDSEKSGQVFLPEEEKFIHTIGTNLSRYLEKKHMEQRSQENSSLMQSTFRVAPTGIGMVIDRVLTMVNIRILEMTGYSEEELIGQSARILYPTQEEYKFVGKEKYRQIGKQGTGHVETRWQKKDGTIMHILLASTPIQEDDQSKGVVFTALDISVQNEVKEQLKQSHEMMDYVIQHMHSAVAVHDRDLNYVYVSQRYLDDYNIKDKDIIGKHLYEVFPDLPQKWRDIHQKALKGEIFSAEKDAFLRDDGSVVWTRWSCRPWYLGENEIGGIIVYTEVITAQVELEEKLKREKEKYRLLVENQTDMIVKIKPSGEFLFVSPSYCRTFGKTEEELIGNSYVPLVHEDYRAYTEDSVNRLKDPPHHGYIEQEALTKTGYRWFSWVNTAILDEKGDITEIIGVGRDISKQKETEIKLQEKMNDLTNFNMLMVGRENRMLELKQEVNELLQAIGKPARYNAPEKKQNSDNF